jgi:hypothetical protein
MSAKKTANIIEFLEDQLKEIEAARYDVVDKSDTSLQQLIDNIVSNFTLAPCTNSEISSLGQIMSANYKSISATNQVKVGFTS